jgi:hypothetical protein
MIRAAGVGKTKRSISIATGKICQRTLGHPQEGNRLFEGLKHREVTIEFTGASAEDHLLFFFGGKNIVPPMAMNIPSKAPIEL